MDISVGSTYTDFTIPEGTKYIEFPDTMTGSIRPGSLNNLKSKSYIKWGVNMLDAVQPGTIPKYSAVMFDGSYKHPITEAIVPSGSPLYIHESNAHLGPANREFWVWRRSKAFYSAEFRDTNIFFKGFACETSCFSFVAGEPIYVAVIALKHKPVVTPKPAVTPKPDVIKTVLAQFAELSTQFAMLQAEVSKLTKAVGYMEEVD